MALSTGCLPIAEDTHLSPENGDVDGLFELLKDFLLASCFSKDVVKTIRSTNLD